MAFLLMNNSRIALVLLSCLILSFFYSLASAQNSGMPTFCTPPYVREGVMITPATSDAFWNDGAACRQYYQVNCLSGTNAGSPFPCQGSGTVLVKIVDSYPPPACRGTIDLSQEAFASIADTAAGVVNISYQQYALTLEQK